MNQKIYTILLLFCFGATSVIAQEDMGMKDDANSSFRMGKTSYSAKPKNAWELGVNLGHYLIDGDVDRKLPAGYGVGLHLRKAVHYVFSVRADLFYGQTKGLETQPWRHKTVGSPIGGGLVEAEYSPYANNPDGWFPSHKTTRAYGSISGIINLGNLLFHKKSNKWNMNIGLGVGLSTHTAKLDLLDANNQPYQNLLTVTGWTSEKFNTKSGRDEIKSALEDHYDGEYETEGPKKAGIFRLGDDTNIHPMFIGSVGVSRKINKRINIGLEHQVMATDNDLLDGVRFRTADDLSSNVDLEHYTNIRLGINLGNLDEISEPLYWMNPLDATMNDIAALKARPILDLTDSDGDGVIDMMDQEVDSPSGAIVDTRGITLDSDSDGVADFKDKEPYSAPGYDVDGNGVAVVPTYVTESDVNNMIDTKNKALLTEVNANTARVVAANSCGKWFLPMIHFDLDKYTIKPEFYGHLHHVANVMKLCPNMCVAVTGHTDRSSGDSYNNVLSYNRANAAVNYLVSNYGIDRSRLKLTYGGEGAPIIGNARNQSEKYMNRRVEFNVCSDENDMGRPEGPRAGSGSNNFGGQNSGGSFRGNKSSGF